MNNIKRELPVEFAQLAVNRNDELTRDFALAEARTTRDALAFWAAWAPSRIEGHVLLSVDAMGGVVVETRNPFTELDQAKAAAGIGPKYNGDLHFLPRCETRPLIDELMKDVVCADGRPAGYIIGGFSGGMLRSHREAMAAEIRARLAFGLLSLRTGRRYKILYIDIRGAEGFFLAVDANVEGMTLKKLKLRLGLSRAVAKRASRFFSPYQVMLGFTIDRTRTEVLSDGVVYHLVSDLTGEEQTCFVPDLSKFDPAQQVLMDGSGILNGIYRLTHERAHRHAYWTPVIGNVGVGKGAGQAVDHVKYDYVVYGPKDEFVLLGDRAYVGVMAEVHLHAGRLDFQTIGNLGFYEPELVVAQGREHFMEIYRAAVDKTDVLARELSAPRLRVDTGKASDTLEVVGEGRTSMWAGKRRELLAIGKDFEPVTFRRWLQPLLENSDDIVKGRVPVPSIFKRINLTPNAMCLDGRGIPQRRLDQLTHERFPDVPTTWMGLTVHIVCAPDMDKGPMLLVRNPNTHSGEAVLVWNQHLPELMRERGAGLVYFGFEAIVLMVNLNGADFDDQVLATTAMPWILKWLSVRRVPGKKLESKAGNTPVNAVVKGTNELDELDVAETAAVLGDEWTRAIFEDRLRGWIEDDMSLGTYINLCMLFNLFTGENGVAMGNDLVQQVKDAEAAIKEAEATILRLKAVAKRSEDEDVELAAAKATVEAMRAKIPVCKKAIRFLATLDPNKVAVCMDNSDVLIDYIQGGKGDPQVAQFLYSTAKKLLVWDARVDLHGEPVMEEIPVFPTCWTIGKNRIPRSRYKEDATPFVLADSKMCWALKSITEMRDKLIDFGRKREYRLRKPLPDAIEKAYPSNDYGRSGAKALADAWRAELDFYIAEHEAAGGHGLPKDGYKWASLGRKRRVKIQPTDADYNKAVGGDQWREIEDRPGLIQKFFYAPDAQGVLKFIRKEYRYQIVAEYYRRMYRRKVDLRYDAKGHVMHYPDGMPDYVVNDFLSMLQEAGLTGLVVVVHLNHYAKTHLTEPVVVVRKEDGGIYRLDGDKLLGESLELATGTYTMSPAGVIVVAEATPELRSTYALEQAKAAVEAKEDPAAIARDTFAF